MRDECSDLRHGVAGVDETTPYCTYLRTVRRYVHTSIYYSYILVLSLCNSQRLCPSATRASVSRALNTSPGNLVFNRDMFVDVPLISNLAAIRDRRQQLIDENLIRENKKRREFRYQAGQEVLLKSVDPRKMDPKAHGPYTIQQVYPNGTIDVARNPHVSERINIRRVIPFQRN